MCLEAEKFLQLIETHSGARKYYMQRAWERRIEVRRRQKKFLEKITHMINEHRSHDHDDCDLTEEFASE